MLLTAIWVCVIGTGAWFLFSQIVTPALFGGRMFPMFRKDPLRERVVEARDYVDDLRDAVAVAKELRELEARKAELERELAGIEAAGTPQQPTQTGEKGNA